MVFYFLYFLFLTLSFILGGIIHGVALSGSLSWRKILPPLEQALPNFVITTDEVLKALQSLKTNTSPGPDNVYPILLNPRMETVCRLAQKLRGF